MKKVLFVVFGILAVIACSTLNVKVEIKTNSAYACNGDNCGSSSAD